MVFIFLAYFTMYNGLQFHPGLVLNVGCITGSGEVVLWKEG